MKLVDVKIENFRGIRSLHLPLDQLTVLIGENNTGKSTVLEAIKLVLTRSFGFRRGGQFSEYDFHLENADATPQSAPTIKIVLHFAEQQEDEWIETIIQQMQDVIQPDITTGLNHIWLHAEGIFNIDSSLFETKLDFLDSSENKLILNNSTSINLISRFVPLFFLSALRDSSQEFGQRGQFWGSFLKSIKLPDDSRQEIEDKLQEINTSVIGANEGLTQVIQKIAEAKQLVSLDSTAPVVLEAIPTRVFDLFGKIQVHLKSTTGAKLPLSRHGEGTQSLSVLMLFRAYVETKLAEDYEPESTPILALEEPEAHLHPSAIRSLGSLLENMVGQTIVSSHSGDLLSRVPVTSLRRLYKRNGNTIVGRIENNITLTSDEERHFDYHVRVNKGSYLFARCWLLVEGQSEFWLFPQLLSIKYSGIDEMNLAIIEFSQGGGPTTFIKAAKALGIEWFVVADGDNEGTKYINASIECLDSIEQQDNRMMQLPCQDLEHEFYNNGYEEFIKNMVTNNRQTQIESEAAGDSIKKTKLLIKAAINKVGGKPAFAQKLVDEVERRSIDSIPQIIQDIMTRVVQLAGN